MYYINEIRPEFIKTEHDVNVIGLYSGGEWRGEGNFCGWYASEYIDNTTLLAYYYESDENDVEIPDEYIHLYKNNNPINLPIHTVLTQIEFECNSDEEAIKMFSSGIIKYDSENKSFPIKISEN